MKKRIWNPLVYAEFAMLVSMGALTGCSGEKTIDYHMDDGTDIPQNGNNTGGTVSQFEGETTWSEIWNIERDGETVEVTVDAGIILPTVEEMYVVTVEVPKFDEQFREQVVKNFYNEEAVYYNDTELGNMVPLTYKNTYTRAEDYEANEYVGTRDDITYVLAVYDYYGEPEVAFDMEYINFYAAHNEEMVPEQYPDYTYAIKHPYMTCEKYADVAENECVYSEQEAEKMARNLVESFGLEYPVLTRSVPLIWGDGELSDRNCNEYPANGYSFTYAYGIDGISFPDFGTESNYESWENLGAYESESIRYAMTAEAEVVVTDKGIYWGHLSNPLETVRITECVKLLPLETIKGIMKETLEKQYEELSFRAGTVAPEFNCMELIYFRVKDKENAECYTYVPAWRLSEAEDMYSYGEKRIRNPILVNAIDGSWINIYENW